MRTTVQTWGNSLAVRIPKAVAEDLGIEKDASVDLTLEDGMLVIAPVSGRKARLKRLLAQINPNNIPDEREPFGRSVGREPW